MPSVSKSQQRAMGMAYAAKKGDIPKSKLLGPARQMAKSMTAKDIRGFATTKHKGLPEKVAGDFIMNKHIMRGFRSEVEKDAAIGSIVKGIGSKVLSAGKKFGRQAVEGGKAISFGNKKMGVKGALGVAKDIAVSKRFSTLKKGLGGAAAVGSVGGGGYMFGSRRGK